MNEKLQTAVITFKKTLPVGSAHLKLQFTASLNDKMCGFYRSTYLAGNESRLPIKNAINFLI